MSGFAGLINCVFMNKWIFSYFLSMSFFVTWCSMLSILLNWLHVKKNEFNEFSKWMTNEKQNRNSKEIHQSSLIIYVLCAKNVQFIATFAIVTIDLSILIVSRVTLETSWCSQTREAKKPLFHNHLLKLVPAIVGDMWSFPRVK